MESITAAKDDVKNAKKKAAAANEDVKAAKEELKAANARE